MDYSKMKVVELKELLASRNLPSTGKKEELISRLNADDASQDTKAEAADSTPIVAPHLAPPDDEFDWENLENDGATASATDAATTTTKSTGAAAAPPVEKKEIKLDVAPENAQPATSSTTSDTATSNAKDTTSSKTFKKIADEFETPPNTSNREPLASTENTSEVKDDKEFTAGLSASNLNDEIAKRKARAARFGVTVDDSVKALERGLRFTTTSDDSSSGKPDKAIRNLDRALGEGRERKRGQEQSGNNERKRSRGTPQAEKNDKSKGILADPTEKAKAEARAKRFGNTS